MSRRETRKIQVDTDNDLVHKLPAGKTCMDEVTEIISMPIFDSKAAAVNAGVERMKTVLAPVVVEQLKAFVTEIALMYNSNPFHNFEVKWMMLESIDLFVACHIVLTHIVLTHRLNYHDSMRVT